MLPPLMNAGFFSKRNVAIIFGVALVLMVAAFMLVDWPQLGGFARSLVPPDKPGGCSAVLAPEGAFLRPLAVPP